MRPLGYTLISIFIFASLSLAQLNLTVYRNPNLSDSVTLRWQQPPGAVPPVTYVVRSGSVLGEYAPLDTLIDEGSYCYDIPQSNTHRRFFSLIATDTQGHEFVSNTCGYQAWVIVGGASRVSTPFGIPFVTWNVINVTPQYGIPSSDPSDIVGDQTHCLSLAYADRILRQDNGEFAIRNSNSACAWTQHLQSNHNLTASHAYWYQNNTAINRFMVICGEVDTTSLCPPVTIHGGSLANSVSTAYAWRESRERSTANLQFVTQGFCEGAATSDRILSQIGGSFVYYRFSDGTWQGSLRNIQPGQAYWIQRRCSTSYEYTYDPTSNDP